MKSRARYREGDWLAVPLGEREGYAIGIVARADRRGHGFIGYFFPRWSPDLPTVEATAGLSPSDAVLVANVSDLAILANRWRIIGREDPWLREAWPMPLFVRRGRDDWHWCTTYDENDLDLPLEERQCRRRHDEPVANDSAWGAEAVVFELARLCGRAADGRSNHAE